MTTLKLSYYFQISELASQLHTTQTHHEEDMAEKEIITSQQNSEIIALKVGLVSTDSDDKSNYRLYHLLLLYW